VYETLIGEVTTAKVNTILSLLTLLMIVSIPMLVIHYKKLRSMTIYELNDYSVSGKFVQGIVSLISINPVSAGLRFYNTFVTLQVVRGYGFKKFLTTIKPWMKRLFEKKPKLVLEEESDDVETLALKKNIRRQNMVYAVRMVVTYFFLVLMALVILVPFYWMVVTSLKTFYESTVTQNPSIFIRLADMQWVNYKVVLQELDFGRYLGNTVLVAIISTTGTIFTTILAAYAFAKIDFKGRELIFSILIMTMMIPGELYIITNFLTVSRSGFAWIGNPAGENNYFLTMTIPFMTSISYIFFLRQNFKQIPDTLYQAARVDGCNDLKYLTRVMVPIASPIIFTITLLNIFGAWNAFIWPRMITASNPIDGRNYWLISVALRDASFNYPGGDRIMYNLQIAASALVTVPLMIVFFAFRKYIMSGVGRSGTKG
jgi:ABC-type glycerol-3-phosphate transport system permease component